MSYFSIIPEEVRYVMIFRNFLNIIEADKKNEDKKNENKKTSEKYHLKKVEIETKMNDFLKIDLTLKTF